MKQYLKCLTIVAFVASLISTIGYHRATPAQAKPTPKAAIRASVTIAPKLVAKKLPALVTYPIGCAHYLPIVEKYNWNVSVAMSVMNAESSCNPSQNTTSDWHPTCMGSRGLFQIGCDSTDDYANMLNPSTNVAQAYKLYASRGWQPWSSTTCRYKVVCY